MLSATAPAPTAELTVAVTDLRSTKGLVQICLTPVASDFPDCKKQPAKHKRTVASNKSGNVVFSALKPGRYAIALLHDENGNGKMDKRLIMPREGFGFSRDAKLRMGPPSFKAAAFDVKPGTNRHSIKVRYIL